MRTIWNGSISFGLVNIPIGLALATQRTDVAFRTLHRECGTPIKQKRWCPFHERDVEPDELVKGWEVAKGEFVLVEESDLESVALQRSQSIEILRFVKLEDVDPIYFDRTYYLAPASAEAPRRPYVLLLRAMQETGMAAVGKFVLWGKENLCLIRAQGDTLALETLFFADDVRAKDEIEEAVEATEIKKAELELAGQVIESLVGEWTHRGLRERVPPRPQGDARGEARRARRSSGRSRSPETPVIDLMEALRRSVAEVQGAKSAAAEKPKAGSTGTGSRKKAAARKSRLRRAQRRASEVAPERRAQRGSVRLRQRAERLQLRLEEVLVDLAVVDRHPFLHAHPDHLLLVDPQLLRELFGREVIRHTACSFSWARKNPPAPSAQTGSVVTLDCRSDRPHSARPSKAFITVKNMP